MVIECSNCVVLVDAKEIASHDAYDRENDPAPYRVTLLECPLCRNTLLAGQYVWHSDDYGNEDIDTPLRVWPNPKRYLPWSIPVGIRTSIEEADKCYKAKAYFASVVMCGRALEGICKHFKVKGKYIGQGIKELRDREIIDNRIFEWSQQLQRHRNIAAHASDEKIDQKDAEDLSNFVIAICEYVFVLTQKFDTFMKRKEQIPHKEPSPSPTANAT